MSGSSRLPGARANRRAMFRMMVLCAMAALIVVPILALLLA